MECEVCREKLADFLLDELPESEAVLVQEHLALCPTCQATYKQLKGTGRALEAVPAMRPVQPSANFSSKVMRAAQEESDKILRDLPTERRIRLQKRRKHKQRRQPSVKSAQPKSSPWLGVLLLLLAGGIALAAILLYYGRSGPAETVPLGTIYATTGRVEQFRPKASTQLTIVKAAQGFRSGDEFLCDEAGRARFDLEGGGSVLLGPMARIRFMHSSKEGSPRIGLLKGELGIERGARAPGVSDWVVVCDQWHVRITPDSRVYFKIQPDSAINAPVVTVVVGVVHIGIQGKTEKMALASGQSTTLSSDAPTIEKTASMPDWRADLYNEDELRKTVSGIAKVVERNAQGLLVELSYGFGRTSLGDDWRPEKDSPRPSVKAGVLHFPNGTRCILNIPLAAPLEVEATVSASVPQDCPWGLALQRNEKKCLSLDLGKEAVLSIGAKPVPRVARIGYRTNAQTEERVRLSVSDKEGGEAILSTSGEKAKPLAVPEKLLEPSTLRIEALGEGLTLDGLRVRGVLPREWLLKNVAVPK